MCSSIECNSRLHQLAGVVYICFLHLRIALSEEAEVTQYHQVANLENVVFNDCLIEYSLRVSTNLMLTLVECDQFNPFLSYLV